MSLEQDFINNTIKGTSKDLLEAFDRNFERKAFFDKRWPASRSPRRGGLQQRGTLRGALKSRTSEMSIFFENAMPYAAIHNEGGKIKVTEKMKKFFWAMYYKTANIKKGEKKRVKKMSIEAEQWKAMALLKIGSHIEIPQRRFLGDHPEVYNIIAKVVDVNFKKLEKQWASQNGFK